MLDVMHRDWVQTPGGLILSHDAARLRYAPPKHPQGGDIFSGCGGWALGAKQAGVHMRFAVEFDPIPAVTYMINLGSYPCNLYFQTPALEAAFEKQITHKDKKTGLTVITRRSGSSGVMDRLSVPGTDHMWVWDASKLTGKMLLDPLGMKPGDLDTLHGSPPCQGVSTSGKKDPHDPRNLLMLEYARLITEIQPKTFTMEQVPNVLNMTLPDGQPIMDAFFDCIEGAGYADRKTLAKMMQMQGVDAVLLRPGRKSNRAENVRGAKAEAKAADVQISLFEEEE
jgi:site-specific DNA-cytosine methylase